MWTAALLLSVTLAAASEAPRIGPSGLPVPRFVSLKADIVNARQGPSFDQPVLWEYRRAGLPLKVTAEADNWRRIEDPEGDKAWVHVATLSERRTVMVRGETTTLLSRPALGGKARAILEPGVVAELAACEGDWRKLKVAGRTGWAPAQRLWGAGECPLVAADPGPRSKGGRS